MLGGQRSRRKSSWGRLSEPLSERPDFNSALAGAVVVFVVPCLNRGNRPDDTERDSGNCNQRLLPAHGNLRVLLWRRDLFCGGAKYKAVSMILTVQISYIFVRIVWCLVS